MTDNSAMKPLIGVTTSELRAGSLRTLSRADGTSRDETFLGTTYFSAVESAGGLPVMLPIGDPANAAALVERLDGILLTGGPDIDPANYGAERHPLLGDTFPSADAFELAVLAAAMAAGKPVLGICRGAQLINVGHGGTLMQHVDGARQAEAADVTTHTLDVADGTVLHRILRSSSVDVNSFHHQAIDRLGDGLRVSARTPTLVKAVESVGHPFVLGVQWHAEALADGALFAALVDAADRQGLRIAA
jgi:putative glutamine amidotransferase